jgi:hypothetical protein
VRELYPLGTAVVVFDHGVIEVFEAALIDGNL